jgi:S-adenosylmethionine:tRNA ribosyltransferase-isomerase
VRLEEFDYELPPDRIAQVPIEPRDASRLLVDRGSAPPEHRTVADLPGLLRAGDVLVVNTTRVIPARLELRRATGGTVEVTLLEPLSADRIVWEALVRPARRLRAGEVLHAVDGRAVLTVGGRSAAGDTFVVEFHAGRVGELDELGEMPLPPYIATRLDRPERYQTVYAAEPGSVAAPTAGLHLTTEVLGCLAAAGVEVREVELVVGADTFRPITSPDPREHPMHGERYLVPVETWEACRSAERVVAVGTTSVRALESAAVTGELAGRTELFLYRGSSFQVVDMMLTNFHLPRTTLVMMIDAFIGPRWRDLYATALAEGYRFLSFGDAALLDRRAR